MEKTISNNINISFTNNSKHFDINFLFKNGQGVFCPEAKIALQLLPSMHYGENIQMQNDPVDKLFLNAITDIQHIYHHWNPRHKIINIVDAQSTKSANILPTGHQKRVATFFSGGVDSFYTLLKHQSDITDIIFVHGLDIPLENTKLRDQTINALNSIAQEFKINLLEVETTLKSILLPYGDWRLTIHGIALATVGLLLQNEFSVIYIPASHHYSSLFPLGTHPILDHLWSTQNLRFIHDGAEATRLQKTELISKSEIALQHLRVCWKNTDGVYNCGKCEKCLRTMTNLYICGKLEECSTFPDKINIKNIAKMKLKGKNIRKFARENIAKLHQMKEAAALEKALKRALLRSMFKGLVKKSYH